MYDVDMIKLLDTMGNTSGPGTAYPSEAPKYTPTPVFRGVRAVPFLVFYVVFL